VCVCVMIWERKIRLSPNQKALYYIFQQRTTLKDLLTHSRFLRVKLVFIFPFLLSLFQWKQKWTAEQENNSICLFNRV